MPIDKRKAKKERVRKRTLDLGKWSYKTEKKNVRVCIRMPDSLHDDIHARAKKLSVSYQHFVRLAMEKALKLGPKRR